MAGLALQSVFVFLVSYAAVSDYLRLKIPNWIPLALLAAFAVAALWLPLANVGAHIMVGLAFFAVATAFYAARLFGGGDVKLIAVIGLWAGPEAGVDFAVLTAVLGAVFGALLLTLKKSLVLEGFVLPRPLAPVADWARRGVCPYGIPIAISALLSVPRLFV